MDKAQELVVALNANGDYEGEARAFTKLEKMMENTLGLIEPRNQGEPKKVIQRNWG